MARKGPCHMGLRKDDSLSRERNAADGRFAARPKDASQMTRNGVPNPEHNATVPCGLRLVAGPLRGAYIIN